MDRLQSYKLSLIQPNIADYDCIAIYYRDMAKYHFLKSAEFVVNAKIHHPLNHFAKMKSWNNVPG